jgi:hypothetical protein
MDYGLDDKVRALAPIPMGDAIAVPVKRLPAKHLVVANVYDERTLVVPDSFFAGFRSAVQKVKGFGGTSISLLDPTNDWNYQEHRADPNTSAELLISAIGRSCGGIEVVRILVDNDAALEAFRSEFDALKRESGD